ncbi:MAG: hypothetical protein WC449_03490 [Candidatus Paceibacterota bacterium]
MKLIMWLFRMTDFDKNWIRFSFAIGFFGLIIAGMTIKEPFLLQTIGLWCAVATAGYLIFRFILKMCVQTYEWQTAGVTLHDRMPSLLKTLFFDIDMTITENDVVPWYMQAILILLLRVGINLVFITGRDHAWGLKYLAFLRRVQGAKGIVFVAYEYGLLITEGLDGEAQYYPGFEDTLLAKEFVRQKIASLFWKYEDIIPYKDGDEVPDGCEIAYDAECNMVLMPIRPSATYPVFPPCPWAYTSPKKERARTAELFRDKKGRAMKWSKAGQKQITKICRQKGIHKLASINVCYSATDFLPYFGKKAFDKSIASGIAVEFLAKRFGKTIWQVCSTSIILGDSATDFPMSLPYFGKKQRGNISFAYVGDIEGYKPGRALSNVFSCNYSLINYQDNQQEIFGSRNTFGVLTNLIGKYFNGFEFVDEEVIAELNSLSDRTIEIRLAYRNSIAGWPSEAEKRRQEWIVQTRE